MVVSSKLFTELNKKRNNMKNRNIYINLLMLVISFTASLSYAQVDGMAIDQINDNYGYYLLDRTSGWQSFTAGTNGHLGAVELYFYSTGTNTSYSGGTNWSATLRIHEGEGTSGAILAEQPITGDGVKQRQTYILEMPVRQIAESKYTFSFEDATAELTVRASTNSYTNGRSHNSIYDYNFKTYVWIATGRKRYIATPTSLLHAQLSATRLKWHNLPI
jgi:hypothetical protein